MRIIASLVLKNEADRYLRAMLQHNQVWWDDLFVYDDQSADDSVKMTMEYTDHVVIRGDDKPSFLDHEGEFRANALKALELHMSPDEDTWIFAIDADEFLVDYRDDLSTSVLLRATAVMADKLGHSSVDLRIPEFWHMNGNIPFCRTDGFWDGMSLPRFFKYRKNWAFRGKSMGAGSGPIYTYDNPYMERANLQLIHVGYVDPKDRQAKYDRYTSLPNHGHNNKHILSIIEDPELRPYDGPYFRFWKGELWPSQ